MAAHPPTDSYVKSGYNRKAEGHIYRQDEQDRLRHEIARHQSADRTYIDGGVRLLELAQDSQNLFAEQESHEQRAAQFYTLELDLGETAISNQFSASHLI